VKSEGAKCWQQEHTALFNRHANTLSIQRTKGLPCKTVLCRQQKKITERCSRLCNAPVL